MKNVLVDSNIIFSGLLYTGKPSEILKLLGKRRLRLLIPVDELEEIRAVFRRKISYREYLLDNFLRMVGARVIPAKRYLDLIPSAAKLIGDKKDAPILACALAVRPDYFITGDKDFSTKEVREKVNAVTPAEFLNEIK
ncbi:MAG: putative toxin-antitoxin system toxin component, PIN family [Candidatus Hodarchaeaceae archaeon]|nr:putative toxin-antitoxin system toxin component, PIN family [Candidatus Hodarchaeaceae archaeon]